MTPVVLVAGAESFCMTAEIKNSTPPARNNPSAHILSTKVSLCFLLAVVEVTQVGVTEGTADGDVVRDEGAAVEADE